MKAYIAALLTLLLTVSSAFAQSAESDVVFGNKAMSSLCYDLGRTREEARDYKGAVIAHTQAIKFDRENAMAWADRGFDRYRIGDIRGGIKDLTQVIRLCPLSTYGAYCGRGMGKAELGEHAAAISDFTSAIRLRPERGFGYVYRARQYCHVGNHSAALSDFKQAIKLEPSNPSNYGKYLDCLRHQLFRTKVQAPNAIP